MIKAAIDISSCMATQMTPDELEDYVRSSLASYVAKELSKTMAITHTPNPITDTHTYTTSIPITHTTSNSLTMSGFNGTVGTIAGGSPITKSSVQENLRVVEYHKNGKVSRVELQFYDGYDWLKVPRIKKEDDE